MGLKPNHPEGNMAMAVAAIDAMDWDAAREALEPVLTTKLTSRACLLMADIEEGETGDQGPPGVKGQTGASGFGFTPAEAQALVDSVILQNYATEDLTAEAYLADWNKELRTYQRSLQNMLN